MGYATPAPAVNARHGAPMGRLSAALWSLDTSKPLSLRRVPLNRGGYDAGGAYWGLGSPLYCVGDHEGETAYFRAASRDGAKAIVRGALVADGVEPDRVRFLR